MVLNTGRTLASSVRYPLIVSTAALLSTLGDDVSESSEDAIFSALLERERANFWRPDFAVGDLERDIAIATATLFAPASRTEAGLLLEMALPDLTKTRRAEIRSWLHSLIPGPNWINPVEPDRIGEYLVHQVLPDFDALGETLTAAVSQCLPGTLSRGLVVLGRVCERRPEHIPTIERVLSTNIEAVRQRSISDDSTSDHWEAIGTGAAQLLDAMKGARLPPLSASKAPYLRPSALSLELARLRLEARGLIEQVDLDPTARTRLAHASNNLAARSFQSFEYSEAAEAATRAVACFSELARVEPEFKYDLAKAMTNLSTFVDYAGDPQRGLTVGKAALKHWRDLYKTEPTRFAIDYARALEFMASRFSRALDPGRGAAFASQSVRIHDDVGSPPEFSTPALITLAQSLLASGKAARALKAADRATSAAELLAKTDRFTALPSLREAKQALLECIRLNNPSDARAIAVEREIAVIVEEMLEVGLIKVAE